MIVPCEPGEETEWASPVVLVKKPDGNIRFCCDFRKMNAVTKKEVHALPTVSSLFEAVGKSKPKKFCLLDMKSAYWNLPIAKEDQPKTCFVVENFGTYKFLKMPFGLTNAPSSFQSLVEKFLPVA